ncbi:MAG: 6-carboxytetrahydropterin synthase QueD [Cyanobacteriota bacterium]
MYEIMIEDTFASAHRLLNYQGICENQHGHNWKVQVFVLGEKLDEAGILVDFKELNAALQNVLSEIDHKDLNSLEAFKNKSPSSELIAKFIFDSLKAMLIEVNKVSVWETEKSKATYWE